MTDLGNVISFLDSIDVLALDHEADTPGTPPSPRPQAADEALSPVPPWLSGAHGVAPHLSADHAANLLSIASDAFPRRPDDQDPEVDPRSNGAPDWDVMAWYRPVHFAGPACGIYITEDGLIEIASRIGDYLPAARSQLATDPRLLEQLFRASYLVLSAHERYHHRCEAAAIRMSVLEQRGFYVPYHEQVYRLPISDEEPLEEGLANAFAWRAVVRTRTDLTGEVRAAVRRYLLASFPRSPAGYRNASRLLQAKPFHLEEYRLLAQLHDGRPHPPMRTKDFALCRDLVRADLIRILDHTWIVGSRRTRLGSSLSPLFRVVVSRDKLLRVLRKKYECHQLPGRGRGSHEIWVAPSGKRPLTVPHGPEFNDSYLKQFAANLGVTWDTFRADLGLGKF